MDNRLCLDEAQEAVRRRPSRRGRSTCTRTDCIDHAVGGKREGVGISELQELSVAVRPGPMPIAGGPAELEIGRGLRLQVTVVRALYPSQTERGGRLTRGRVGRAVGKPHAVLPRQTTENELLRPPRMKKVEELGARK